MSKRSLDKFDSNISAARDKIMEDLRLVMENAEELLQATASQTGEAAVTARARLLENLSTLKNRVLDVEQSVIEQTKQAYNTTDQYVKENPWKAIGLSAFAGVIIGMLISRPK